MNFERIFKNSRNMLKSVLTKYKTGDCNNYSDGIYLRVLVNSL